MDDGGLAESCDGGREMPAVIVACELCGRMTERGVGLYVADVAVLRVPADSGLKGDAERPIVLAAFLIVMGAPRAVVPCTAGPAPVVLRTVALLFTFALGRITDADDEEADDVDCAE